VTITLPGHPCRGRPLPLVRLARSRDGTTSADVKMVIKSLATTIFVDDLSLSVSP